MPLTTIMAANTAIIEKVAKLVALPISATATTAMARRSPDGLSV